LVHHLIHPLKTGLSSGVERYFEKLYIRQADFAITNSEFTTDEIATLGFNRENATVVYPGIDIITPRQYQPDNDILKLLCVGFLEERKGYHVLLEALKHIDNEFELDVAGDDKIDPEYTRLIRKQIDAFSLRDRVKLHGHIDEQTMEKLKSGADIFVSPTLHEGFGIAALEAAAYGLPVITSAAGAIPEIFTDGVDALLTKPGDSLSLRNAINTLINDKELRKKLAIAGPQTAFARRSWDEVGKDFVEAINTIFQKISSDIL